MFCIKNKINRRDTLKLSLRLLWPLAVLLIRDGNIDAFI